MNTPEKNAYLKEWRKTHPNYWKGRKNKSKPNKEYQKKWRENNKDQKHEYYKKYYENNKYKFIKNRIKRTHKMLDMDDDTITKGSLEYLLNYQNYKCNICKCNLTKTKKNLDHIIPLAKGGIHSIFNVQWLCEHCNKSKHSKLPQGQLSIFAV